MKLKMIEWMMMTMVKNAVSMAKDYIFTEESNTIGHG